MYDLIKNSIFQAEFSPDLSWFCNGLCDILLAVKNYYYYLKGRIDMKRAIAFILAIAVILTFASCSATAVRRSGTQPEEIMSSPDEFG